MNTAVFQYYVKMVGYSDGVQPGAQESGSGALNAITDGEAEQVLVQGTVEDESAGTST